MVTFSNYRVIDRNKPLSASRNLIIGTDGARTTICHITATSSGAGVWEGTMDPVRQAGVGESGADWYPLPAITVNTAGVTRSLPGATITPTDDDVMVAENLGARYVRFRRTAGTATASLALSSSSLEDVEASAGATSTVDTELPAAAALADNTATPTAPAVGAFGMVYDGTNWDMARGTSADGTLVNLGTNNDVTITSVPAVSCYSFIGDGTDELLVDATARKCYGVYAYTIDATPVYVKLYDKATAASEADTPIFRLGVPANSTAANGAGNNAQFPVPISLTNGLSVRLVTGIADNSDAAVTTAECYVNILWSA